MKKTRRVIKGAEISLLNAIFKSPRSLNTNELANKSGISWATADKYLRKWYEKGVVMKALKKSKEIWKINAEATLEQLRLFFLI